MPRERLMGYCDQEESFEEQMDALGVEVVRPKTEVKWYKHNLGSSGNAALINKVSVATGGITIGSEAVEMLGACSKLKIAVVKTKKPDGSELITFALKPSEKGLKIMKIKNTNRFGSKTLMNWLFDNGIKKGRYELKKIDGGYLAVACKDGGAK